MSDLTIVILTFGALSPVLVGASALAYWSAKYYLQYLVVKAEVELKERYLKQVDDLNDKAIAAALQGVKTTLLSVSAAEKAPSGGFVN